MNNTAYCPKCDRVHGLLYDCTKKQLEPSKTLDYNDSKWGNYEKQLDISYCNTKEGMHATAKERGISPWALGCDCFDCNRQFEAVRAGLPTEQSDSVEFKAKLPNTNFNTEVINEEIAELECHKLVTDSVGNLDQAAQAAQAYFNSMYGNQVWNAAIEAAALSVHTSKGYPTQYSDTIRKLKK